MQVNVIMRNGTRRGGLEAAQGGIGCRPRKRQKRGGGRPRKVPTVWFRCTLAEGRPPTRENKSARADARAKAERARERAGRLEEQLRVAEERRRTLLWQRDADERSVRLSALERHARQQRRRRQTRCGGAMRRSRRGSEPRSGLLQRRWRAAMALQPWRRSRARALSGPSVQVMTHMA